MKKYFFIIVLFLLAHKSYNQNYNIEYEYEDLNKFKCKANLYIKSNKESLFRVNDQREGGITQDAEENMITVYNDKVSKIIYSTNAKSIVRLPLYTKEIIYEDVSSKIKWTITKETKKIGKFTCQKAKINLNGRKYSIWFTPEIEIAFGPYKINGLPGLVVELYEETSKTKITLISIKKLDDSKDFENYKKYILSKKVLSYTEYEVFLIKTMKQKKKNEIAKVKEYGATISYSDNQAAFTEHIIDIPTNLVSELRKIK
jgi:GLPGLI family protein